MNIISSIILLAIFIAVISFFQLFHLSSDQDTSSLGSFKIVEDAHAVQKYVADLEKKIFQLQKMSAITEEKLNESKAMENIESEKEENNSRLGETGEETAIITAIDENSEAWQKQLFLKLKCLRLQQGALYLYHVRKAAGTSMRDILHLVGRAWKVPVFETEGVVLDPAIFAHSGLTSVITLRNPIERVLSLYWYEHVGWFHGVLKQTAKCKTLKEWVAGWRDGSEWKTNFIRKNPGTVYVEVENYYVKMLTGWKDAGHKVNETDFIKAKEVLQKFDLVFLTDWMGDDTQVDAMNAVFPGRSNVAMGHKIRGDHNTRTKLTPTLAPDELEQRELLTSINDFDLRLWDYAQSLMAYRLKLIVPVVNAVKRELGLNAHRNTVSHTQISEAQLRNTCGSLDFTLTKEQRKSMGVVRPAGHKGPL